MENRTVARVIYSEASLICSDEERHLVASVIKNRIGHKGFGGHKTMEEVVLAPNQFSCVGDKKNSNWWISELEFLQNDELRKVWIKCLELSKGDFTSEKDIVYYHDKNIEKPASWDNKWWNTEIRRETEWFKFYSVKERILKDFENESVVFDIRVNKRGIVL